MNEHLAQQRMDALLAERADQPFGDHESVSGRTLQPFSRASHDAAANLLEKALHALMDGDEDRAKAFATRAARLPFDRHEETLPAASETHMMLFNTVIDEVEASDADDSRWLDAALDALSSAEPDGAASLREVLAIVVSDYQPTPAERRRIRAAVGEIPVEEALRARRLEPDELTAVILSVLRTVIAYERAIDALHE